MPYAPTSDPAALPTPSWRALATEAASRHSACMTFSTVTPDEMFAAQLLTGSAMAGFLLAGLIPHYGGRIRLGVAALYFAGVAGFVVYFLVR